MKIFGLGLHKTGTTSLAKALEILGYRTRDGFKRESDLILQALFEQKPPLQLLEEKHGTYDAFTDLYAVRDHFPALDKAYPNSKFILTVREENEWVESVKKQIKKRPDSPFFHHWYYQTELQWRRFKQMHENLVLSYFENRFRRQDLLMIDVTDNGGWKELCHFLDKPIPNKPFPHKNKS